MGDMEVMAKVWLQVGGIADAHGVPMESHGDVFGLVVDVGKLG